MRGGAIDDAKDRALCAGDQALLERDEDSGVDATFFDDHQPHMATRSDAETRLMAWRVPVAWTIGVAPHLSHPRRAG